TRRSKPLSPQLPRIYFGANPQMVSALLSKPTNTTPWQLTSSQQNTYAPFAWDEKWSKDSTAGASGWPTTTSIHKTFPAHQCFGKEPKQSESFGYKARKRDSGGSRHSLLISGST